MKTYEFDVLLKNVPEVTDDQADALFAASTTLACGRLRRSCIRPACVEAKSCDARAAALWSPRPVIGVG